jgi:hypothetical protein
MCKTEGVQLFCVREPAIGIGGALSYHHDPAICDDLILHSSNDSQKSNICQLRDAIVRSMYVCTVIVCTYAHTS